MSEDLRGQFRVVSDETQSTKKDDWKKRKRKRKAERIYKAFLIILVIAAGVVGYLIYVKTKIYDSYSVVSKVKPTELLSGSPMNFKGSIMSFSKDGAGAADTDGNLLWNQTFDMQTPMMAECGGMVAFADYGGSKIYVQSQAGEAKEISTAMPIRKIRISENGYIVAVLEDSDVTWIYMYDLNGTVIAYFRTTMEKSGYPIDLDISNDGELVAVSYYYLDYKEERSSVAFYNFGEVGQNNIDNYVSGYNYSDSLVPMVRFINSETAVAVSESRISFYSGAHKPISIADVFLNEEPLSVYTGKDTVALIFDNEANDSKYRLELYGLKGEKITELAFDFDYSGIAFGNSEFVLYGDTSIYIGTYSGEKRYFGEYSEDIKLVIPTVSSSKYVFVTEKTIDTIEFK